MKSGNTNIYTLQVDDVAEITQIEDRLNNVYRMLQFSTFYKQFESVKPLTSRSEQREHFTPILTNLVSNALAAAKTMAENNQQELHHQLSALLFISESEEDWRVAAKKFPAALLKKAPVSKCNGKINCVIGAWSEELQLLVANPKEWTLPFGGPSLKRRDTPSFALTPSSCGNSEIYQSWIPSYEEELANRWLIGIGLSLIETPDDLCAIYSDMQQSCMTQPFGSVSDIMRLEQSFQPDMEACVKGSLFSFGKLRRCYESWENLTCGETELEPPSEAALAKLKADMHEVVRNNATKAWIKKVQRSNFSTHMEVFCKDAGENYVNQFERDIDIRRFDFAAEVAKNYKKKARAALQSNPSNTISTIQAVNSANGVTVDGVVGSDSYCSGALGSFGSGSLSVDQCSLSEIERMGELFDRTNGIDVSGSFSSVAQCPSSMSITIFTQSRRAVRKECKCAAGREVSIKFRFPQSTPSRLLFRGSCPFKLDGSSPKQEKVKTPPAPGRSITLEPTCNDFSFSVKKVGR